MSNESCLAQVITLLQAVAPSGSCLYGFHAWPSAQGMAREPVFVSCRLVKHNVFSVPCRPTTRQVENNLFSLIFSPSAETLHHLYQYNN